MTERWQRELKKLGDVDAPVSRMRAQIASGPREDPSQPEPGRSPRQRITAGVVAFVVFAAAGVFAYRALKPAGLPDATAGSGALPPLTIHISADPSVSPAFYNPPSSSGFVATVRFGDAEVSTPPTLLGNTGPDTPTSSDPAVISYWPGMALTTGSVVHLSTDSSSLSIALTPQASFGTPGAISDALVEGSSIPDPGSYILGIDAKWPGVTGLAEWSYRVDVVPNDTIQLYSPSSDQNSVAQSSSEPKVPDVQLLVDGHLFTGQPATDAPVPGESRRAEVAAGSPVWVTPRVDSVGSFGLSFEPDQAGTSQPTVNMDANHAGPVGTVDVAPGDYRFGVHAEHSSFGVVFPITVVPADAPVPGQTPPQVAAETLRLDMNTTDSTTDCPGSPKATISYGDESTKGAPTSYAWTCPGSSMNADTVGPSFSPADFVQVPAGAHLGVTGDSTAAEGELQSFQGEYPWPTVHDLGSLSAGPELALEPGQYILEVTAHWTNGTLHFYFPIELAQASGATAPPPTVPDVLEVSCVGGVPSPIDPTVAVQVDGLHIRMVGQAPPNEELAFYGRDDFYLPTGKETFSSGTYSGEFTRMAAIGTYDVKCFSRGMDPATLNAAAAFEVIDPNGFWVSTDVTCPPEERATLRERSGESPTQEAAVRGLAGVLASDIVEPAGYTQEPSNSLWRVLRNGDVVAWTYTFGSSGSWHAGHGVGCISAGTGRPKPA